MSTNIDNINIPICFIQGDSDPITPTSLVNDYYEIIMSDKKEMIVINNAGHTPFLDKPKLFCEAVKTFLSECKTNNTGENCRGDDYG